MSLCLTPTVNIFAKQTASFSVESARKLVMNQRRAVESGRILSAHTLRGEGFKVTH